MAATTTSKTSRSTPDDVLTPPTSTKFAFAVPAMQYADTNSPAQPRFQTRSATAVHRPSPAPRNDRNEIYCTHEDCLGKNVTFRRLCEWNKHMDRHERPYKCSHSNCQNAQGFTYSGGLMRHQREVHRWHQTTRSRLFCPYPECVRSAGGEGFSRKENLEEHKRRRHPELHPSTGGHIDGGASSDEHDSKKRKRLGTPLTSDDSPKPNSLNDDTDNAADTSAPETADVDANDGNVMVQNLKRELAVAHEEILRLKRENDVIRGQMSQYYAFISQTPLQVYPVNQGAPVAQGYMPPPQSAYGMAYESMHSAYKK